MNKKLLWCKRNKMCCYWKINCKVVTVTASYWALTHHPVIYYFLNPHIPKCFVAHLYRNRWYHMLFPHVAFPLIQVPWRVACVKHSKWKPERKGIWIVLRSIRIIALEVVLTKWFLINNSYCCWYTESSDTDVYVWQISPYMPLLILFHFHL